jgi:hypothetical protein
LSPEVAFKVMTFVLLSLKLKNQTFWKVTNLYS